MTYLLRIGLCINLTSHLSGQKDSKDNFTLLSDLLSLIIEFFYSGGAIGGSVNPKEY